MSDKLRRAFHSHGVYWESLPTALLRCDFCNRPFTAHDPGTRACQGGAEPPGWEEACAWAASYVLKHYGRQWHDERVAHQYMDARNGYLAGMWRQGQ